MEPETRVWIAQCMCPNKHAIIAYGYEAGLEDDDPLHKSAFNTVSEELGMLLGEHPEICGCLVCGAPVNSWIINTGRTRWKSMAEAKPTLDRMTDNIVASVGLLLNLRGKRPPTPAHYSNN